jgi:hypothetical protein
MKNSDTPKRDGDIGGSEYFLPKGLINFKFSRDEPGKDIKFEVSSKIVADDNYKLYLSYGHNVAYDDKAKIQIDANGLLQSINTTSNFKIPEFFEKLGALAGYAVAFASTTCKGDEANGKFSIDHDIDPFKKGSTDDLNNDLSRYCLSVDFDPPNNNKITEDTTSSETGDTGTKQAIQVSGNGIAYRRLTTKKIIIKSNELNIKREFTVILPDASEPPLYAAVERGIFSDNITNYTFSQGLLTSSELERPSEMIGFISIPLKILKGVSDAIIGRFGMKTEEAKNEASYAQAQKTLLDANKALLDAKNND